MKIKSEWLQENGLYECPICQKQYKRRGILSHIWRTHGDGRTHNSNIGYIKGTRTAWNKGLTKETDSRVKKNADAVSVTIKDLVKNGLWVPNKMGPDAIKQLSIRQSIKNSGGKCKWYEVDNQKVQGTWERDLALLMSHLNIKWEKLKCNKDVIIYFMDGKEHSYTPDFYLPDHDLYMEVKGYWWGDDKRKMELVFNQNPDFAKKCIVIKKQAFYILLECDSKDDFIGTVAEMV